MLVEHLSSEILQYKLAVQQSSSMEEGLPNSCSQWRTSATPSTSATRISRCLLSCKGTHSAALARLPVVMWKVRLMLLPSRNCVCTNLQAWRLLSGVYKESVLSKVSSIKGGERRLHDRVLKEPYRVSTGLVRVP